MRRRSFLLWSAGTAGDIVLRSARARQTQGRVNARVAVVGGGFAGSTCALALRRLSPMIDVTVIDPDQRYVTCPMSNSALVGLRSINSISVSRRGLEDAGIHYVRDRVSSIDTRQRRVRFSAGELSYDRLVMASGIRFLWETPQGYDEPASRAMPHAWQAGAQTELLAAQLRAMREGGVVAISVPAGPMRCPPGPFERASLIAAYLRQRNRRAKILIFDSNNHFPKQDVFTDAWQSLYPGMIEWIPVTQGGAVMRVAPAQMTLYTSQGEHRVDVANIIPPQAPGLPAVQAGLASDHGWCPIAPASFESTLIAGVHVIGDACIAEPMPKSASAANAQARQCALAVVASLQGREPPAAPLESVCYSVLGLNRALSIHGRYHLSDGVLEQIPTSEDQNSTLPTQEAKNAELWYRRIVSDSFGV